MVKRSIVICVNEAFLFKFISVSLNRAQKVRWNFQMTDTKFQFIDWNVSSNTKKWGIYRVSVMHCLSCASSSSDFNVAHKSVFWKQNKTKNNYKKVWAFGHS